MTIDLDPYLRSQYIGMELQDILKQPPDIMLGVNHTSAKALERAGIHTIFDLGTSWIFANARAAASAGRAGTLSARYGMAPADWLNDGVAWEDLEDIGALDLQHLRGLPGQAAQGLKNALDVKTIRDFAFWPPQQIARQLVNESMGGTFDPETLESEQLRPRFGEYPTERTYYSTLVMLQMGETGEDRVPLEQPLSLKAAAAQRLGFKKIAIGALLTFKQSWYAQGITLGQMLHSLALAPGEATRIAVIDWTRRTRATASVTISETEQLDNASLHTRALSEVQNAVANEFQAGGSTSSSASTSSSGSTAASAGTGFLTSLYASADVTGSYQTASTQASASSSSWSLGNRSVFAEMTQNVNDRTEQHSTSVRNRRATAVREVSQTESEQISTRIVANYNHMHALTIQYYEVVQIYRVVAQLQKAERCLFIPLDLLDFSAQDAMDLVDQFRGALLGAALNRRIASLLLDDTTTVAIRPTTADIRLTIFRPEISGLALKSSVAAGLLAVQGIQPPAPVAAEAPAPLAGVNLQATTRVWDNHRIAQISGLLDRTIVRPGSDALHFPDDAEIVGISFDGLNIKTVQLDRVDALVEDSTYTVPSNSGRLDIPFGLRLLDVQAILLAKADDPARSGKVTLQLSYQGRRFSTPEIPVELAAGIAMQKVISFENDRADRRQELLAHLKANRAHYSSAVFRSLDSATIVTLLSPFTFDGRPLIDQVEPKPVSVAGNFLVLRAPVAGDESSGVSEDGDTLNWSSLLERRQVNFEPDARLVPIQTAGVFAEAVLGRSNSAEKLDITRFWNWQDSPIPLSPPDIAPVSAGSRAESENLTPGQLGQPVLNILNPTSLPDPAGLNAILTALSNGNMFRDMSGLAGTQDLARAGMQGTLQAATEAGQLASENMRTEAQKSVAMAQVLGDIVKAYLGAPGGGGGSQGISGEGARINHGRDMDERGVNAETPASPAGDSAGASGGGVDVGPGSGSGPGQSGAPAGGAAPAGATGHRGRNETAAFNRGIGNPGNVAEKLGQVATSSAGNAPKETTAENAAWRPPAGIGTLKVWLKAFIPANVPGHTVTLSAGPHSGKTALSGPVPGVSDCFLTDQRTFSNSISASARMHSEIEFFLNREMPTFRQFHDCGETVEVDCEDGEEECRNKASNARMSFHNLRLVSPTIVTVQLRAAANNPCYTGSPDIDYEGTLIIDLTAMTVTFDGKIDEFPAFEAYVSRDGSAPVTLFQEPPPPGNSPANLFGKANRPVGRSVGIPAAP